MSAGMAVVFAGVLLMFPALSRCRDWGDAMLVAGTGNVVMGIGLAIAGSRLHHPWGGAANFTIGVLLLWAWWTRGGGRHRCRKWLGAKSAAVRAALVRRMREAAQPA